MSDPTKRQDFTNTIKEIMKRLRNLEGRGIANNMTLHTNAEQHGINVVNQNDIEMIRLGRLQESNPNPVLNFESDGLAVFNSATGGVPTLWIDFATGVVYPYLQSPIKDSNAFSGVTSGSYANVYETWLNSIPSAWFQTRFAVVCPVGTTGDMQWVVNGVTVGSVQGINSGDALTYNFKVLHGSPVSTGPYSIALQVRRLTGAGTIAIFEPFPITFGNPHNLPVGGWEVG